MSSLYFFWSYFGIASDLPADIESYDLTSSTWPLFITYFVLANSLIEEYFWRGFLGSPTRGSYPSDFLYAIFHAMILMNKMQIGAIIHSLVGLVLAAACAH